MPKMSGCDNDKIDYIFYGTIITMNEKYPEAEALAIKDDRIFAVGTKKEIKQLETTNTRVVNLGDQVLMPGLIEAHTHAIDMVDLKTTFKDINGYDYHTHEAVETLITNEVEKAEGNLAMKDKTIIFFGWDPELVPNMPTLTKEYIDNTYTHNKELLSDDQKVAVVIIGESYHIGWANQKAFDNARVLDEEQYRNLVDDNYIIDGSPGKFLGIPSVELMIKANKVTLENDNIKRELRRQWFNYNKAGITTATELAHDASDQNMVSILKEISNYPDDYPLRLYLYTLELSPDTPLGSSCCPRGFSGSARHKGNDPEEFEANTKFLKLDAGMKIISDGSPHSGTMAIREPFLKNNITDVLGFPPEVPNYGQLHFKTEMLDKLVQEYHKQGQQIAIHAHGERACDQVLTAYEKILLNDPGSDRRHRMEHLGLMTEEQIEWASRLKLGLSFNVNILYFYATAFSNFIVGPERTNRWAPSYLASKYGVKWTLHQDHPSHPGPISPFMSMQTAVTRTELGKPNKVYGPEYRVSIHEALKAYTINAAWQLHANNDLGILDKGKFADLLILGKNPYSYADRPEDLGKIPVVGTFVGGQPNDGLLKFVKKTDGTEKFYILEHIEICPV